MHLKVVYADSWDFGQALSRQIKWASSGISGHDFNLLQKHAGDELAARARKLEFAPGEIPLHAIGLGAFEKYSCNRNADGFSERTLRATVSSFEKYAHYFKNHANGPTDKRYGRIKLAFYNEPMSRVELIIGVYGTAKCARDHGGFVNEDVVRKLEEGRDVAGSMACFKADARVKRWDGTYCPISEIAVGDEVCTHHGNRGIVTVKSQRRYAGDFVRLKIAGFPDQLEATENHKIWIRPTLRGKAQICPVCGRQFKSLRCHFREKTDPQHRLAAADYGRYAENWCEAKQLTIGDYVRIPINTAVAETGDPVYAELLGFYVSEGNTWQYERFAKRPIDTYRGVDFSFHRDEVELAERTITLLHELGYTRTHTYLRKNNVRLVRVNSAELADRLERDGGRLAAHKKLSTTVMGWSPLTQKRLLESWLEGDGTFSKRHSTVVGVSISRTLCRQMAEIGWRNGIAVRIGRSYGAKKYETCVIRATEVNKLSLRKIPSDYRPPGPVSVACGQLRHQAASAVTRLRMAAKPESFIEGDFLYCRIRGTTRIYDTCDVFNMTVETDNSYTVEDVGVSNCKLAYDVCSACGNKAKTRKDYCKSAEEGGTCTLFGCRSGLAKVAASGHIQHVDNPMEAGLRFFDYSHVGNPADYIAYGGRADYLSKSASENRIVSGSELGSMYSLLPPLELCLTDCLREPHRRQIKAAHEFAAVEHEWQLGQLIAKGAMKQPELLPDRAEKRSAWAALASRGVMLSLSEFARQTGATGQEKQAAAELPGFYSRVIAEGQLEHFVRSNPYTDIPAFSEQLQGWAVKQATLYALTKEALHSRVLTYDTALPLVRVKAAALDPDHENTALATAYASYKLAYYAGTAASFVLTPRNVILQNYDCDV